MRALLWLVTWVCCLLAGAAHATVTFTCTVPGSWLPGAPIAVKADSMACGDAMRGLLASFVGGGEQPAITGWTAGPVFFVAAGGCSQDPVLSGGTVEISGIQPATSGNWHVSTAFGCTVSAIISAPATVSGCGTIATPCVNAPGAATGGAWVTASPVSYDANVAAFPLVSELTSEATWHTSVVVLTACFAFLLAGAFFGRMR